MPFRCADIARILPSESALADPAARAIRCGPLASPASGCKQQALFAYVDTLTKTILTCMPEPLADAKPQAVARAKERYDRLIKSAGRAMVGEAKLAMQDLVANFEA